jgi:Uma2 family endonuclease
MAAQPFVVDRQLYIGHIDIPLRRDPFAGSATLSRPDRQGNLVRVVLARIIMSIIAEIPYRTHRFSVADYNRLGEVGLLTEDDRVELIEGEIIEMAPIGSRHAGTVDFLTARLFAAAQGLAMIRVQSPIVLDDFSEPQPDVAVLLPRADFYRHSHPRPGDVLLVIEVAETTLSYDREKKLPLYANAGVPEVWIVDVAQAALHAFRLPAGDRYETEQVVVAPTTMTIAMLPETVVDLSGLFET